MDKNKKSNNSKIIFGIILLILIVLCVGFIKRLYDDAIKEKDLYSDLKIDKTKLNIFYLNVGQADSTLIVMGDDVMLIDAGNKSDGINIVNFLKSQKINEIDYLIETHSDDDHSGGIEEIVHNLNVAQIYMPKSAINKNKR